MRTIRYAAVTVLALGAFTVNAQTMYRCGNSYSQQPCGPDAKTIATTGVVQPATAPPDPQKVEKMKELCASWVRNVPLWKDKDSLKLGTVYRGQRDVRTIDGRSNIVWSYHVMVNGKNSYGGYEGERAYVCFADDSETRIVDLYKPGDIK